MGWDQTLVMTGISTTASTVQITRSTNLSSRLYPPFWWLWEDTKLLQFRCCVGCQKLFFKIIVSFVVVCGGWRLYLYLYLLLFRISGVSFCCCREVDIASMCLGRGKLSWIVKVHTLNKLSKSDIKSSIISSSPRITSKDVTHLETEKHEKIRRNCGILGNTKENSENPNTLLQVAW